MTLSVDPAPVLVTGLNGYIATHVAYAFLSRGYNVRGTVRSSSKAAQMREAFSTLQDVDIGKLEVVVVENIEKAGAFDEAVKGVQTIMHLAAPFHFGGQDVKDYVDPSVNGTISLLESARKHAGPALRRILIASSVASISGTRAGAPVGSESSASTTHYSESDWNTHDVNEMERLGNKAGPVVMYCAAKTLGEKAAWDFVDRYRTKIGWDLVTICPPYVFGPLLFPTAPSQLNTSLNEVYTAIVMRTKSPAELTAFRGNWVDVRDVAEACVRAVERAVEGMKDGKRCTLVRGSFVWDDWFKVLNALALPYLPPLSIPTSSAAASPPVVEYDTTNTQAVLGLHEEQMRSLESTARDTVESFWEKGLIGK